MNSALNDLSPRQAQAVTAGVRTEISAFHSDESRVSLPASRQPSWGSVGVIVDGADCSPRLIDAHKSGGSPGSATDVLRAWPRAGHRTRTTKARTFTHRAGERVPAPEATEPVASACDSYSSGVRVGAAREYDATAAAAPGSRAPEIPYLIPPGGSLHRAYRHGLLTNPLNESPKECHAAQNPDL